MFFGKGGVLAFAQTFAQPLAQVCAQPLASALFGFLSKLRVASRPNIVQPLAPTFLPTVRSTFQEIRQPTADGNVLEYENGVLFRQQGEL